MFIRTISPLQVASAKEKYDYNHFLSSDWTWKSSLLKTDWQCGNSIREEIQGRRRARDCTESQTATALVEHNFEELVDFIKTLRPNFPYDTLSLYSLKYLHGTVQ